MRKNFSKVDDRKATCDRCNANVALYVMERTSTSWQTLLHRHPLAYLRPLQQDLMHLADRSTRRWKLRRCRAILHRREIVQLSEHKKLCSWLLTAFQKIFACFCLAKNGVNESIDCSKNVTLYSSDLSR